jgi:hypothetical protein
VQADPSPLAIINGYIHIYNVCMYVCMYIRIIRMYVFIYIYINTTQFACFTSTKVQILMHAEDM